MTQIIRMYRAEFILFDGVETYETVNSEFTAGDNLHDEALAAAAWQVAAASITGSGQPNEGWTVSAVTYWPIVRLIP